MRRGRRGQQGLRRHRGRTRPRPPRVRRTTGHDGDGHHEDAERTGKTETSERKRDDKGGSSGSSGSGSGGSDDSSGGGSGGGGKSQSPEKELTGKNVYSTAKTVCSSFLPTALEKELKDGKKSAEDIAKDYSKGYPAERAQARA